MDHYQHCQIHTEKDSSKLAIRCKSDSGPIFCYDNNVIFSLTNRCNEYDNYIVQFEEKNSRINHYSTCRYISVQEYEVFVPE